MMEMRADVGHGTGKNSWGEFWRKLWGWMFGRKHGSQATLAEAEEEESWPRENPYLHRLRGILEQLLGRYQMSYREFRPLLIDTDTPPESLLEEDQVEVVLEQISEDLNFLLIVTDRPAYFADYIQRMYEDSGLVVQIGPKGQGFPADANVILDMEQQGDCPLRHIGEHVLYIPVYKRRWGPAESVDNLDISIPIGYNTVIVKGV
ncbi:MAG: hypothetical protein HFH36_09995 [Lachnospiraceae bacterium]|nr:hypothetical protein [Lachnospiraceae bacterium]